MSCNCKKTVELEEKYGDRVDESLLGKVLRFLWALMMFFVVVGLAVVIVPIMIVVIIYKIFFGDDTNIILPKFLGKYLK